MAEWAICKEGQDLAETEKEAHGSHDSTNSRSSS